MSGDAAPAPAPAVGAGVGSGSALPTLVGVGIDAVPIARLRRAVERTPTLIDRLFTAAEQDECRGGGGLWRWWKLAARFAAKEAVAKAFGTGVDGFSFTEVEVVNNADGRPEVVLSGGAERVARERGVGHVHLSLSHTEDLALAQAVAERAPAGPEHTSPG